MFAASLKFGQIDILKPRSVASDLSLKNEGKGFRRPVSVCHIESENQRLGCSNGTASHEENTKRVQAPTVGRDSQCPIELRTALGTKTTNQRRSPPERRHSATIDDRIFALLGRRAVRDRSGFAGEIPGAKIVSQLCQVSCGEF